MRHHSISSPSRNHRLYVRSNNQLQHHINLQQSGLLAYQHLDVEATLDRLVAYLPFFFFQAEDGIRYWSVTGVQTCALPISDGVGEESRREEIHGHRGGQGGAQRRREAREVRPGRGSARPRGAVAAGLQSLRPRLDRKSVV